MASEKWFIFPGWPDIRCWKVIAGRSMKPEDFIPALQNQRTALLTGFKSKSGKAFDAYLILDAKAKTFSFAFDARAPDQNGNVPSALKLTRPKQKAKRKP